MPWHTKSASRFIVSPEESGVNPNRCTRDTKSHRTDKSIGAFLDAVYLISNCFFSASFSLWT